MDCLAKKKKKKRCCPVRIKTYSTEYFSKKSWYFLQVIIILNWHIENKFEEVFFSSGLATIWRKSSSPEQGLEYFLLWKKLIHTKLYLHVPKLYHNTKIHIAVGNIRALRLNKWIHSLGDSRKNCSLLKCLSTCCQHISKVSEKNYSWTESHTWYINLSVRSTLL